MVLTPLPIFADSINFLFYKAKQNRQANKTKQNKTKQKKKKKRKEKKKKNPV